MMKQNNLWKKTVSTLKQNFVTDQVFWENEVQANLLVLRFLIAGVVLLGLCLVMNMFGILAIDHELAGRIFLSSFLVMLVPITACMAVKGAKRWVKYTMMAAVIFALAYIDRVMTFNVPVLIVIPVIFSCRYYSGAFTVQTAAATTAAFTLSMYIGARNVIGSPDMNFIADTASEYVRNVMLQSFLPKWMFFLVAAGVCYEIARCGRNMVLKQESITKFNTRVETELELANRIQAQALPPVTDLPESSARRVDLAARMIPAKEVGGDFYDFIELDSGHLALIIADVADKGIAAALYMMMSKSLLDSRVLTTPSPGAVLEAVNRQLFGKSLRGMFVTVWLGILDLNTGELVTANAGHEYPAIRRKNGSFELYRDKHGFVLGASRNIKYAETRLRLEEGDILFVYTDGVPEANDPSREQFGLTRMLKSLDAHSGGSMDELIDGVKADVDAFAEDAPQFDDTTMLAVKLLEQKDRKLVLKPEMQEIGRAQNWMAAMEQEMHLTDLKQKKIAISMDELLSNIIRYSRADTIELEFIPGEQEFSLVIRDNGTAFNPLEFEPPDTSAPLMQRKIGGLGIMITRKYMDRTAYRREDGWNIFTATALCGDGHD